MQRSVAFPMRDVLQGRVDESESALAWRSASGLHLPTGREARGVLDRQLEAADGNPAVARDGEPEATGGEGVARDGVHSPAIHRAGQRATTPLEDDGLPRFAHPRRLRRIPQRDLASFAILGSSRDANTVDVHSLQSKAERTDNVGGPVDQ